MQVVSNSTQCRVQHCMPFFEMNYIEVYRQAQRFATQPEVRKSSAWWTVRVCPPAESAEIFENSRRAHAPANTHRHHSVTCVSTLQFAKDCGCKLCARTSQGM